jgi:hypothetical protein
MAKKQKDSEVNGKQSFIAKEMPPAWRFWWIAGGFDEKEGIGELAIDNRQLTIGNNNSQWAMGNFSNKQLAIDNEQYWILNIE